MQEKYSVVFAFRGDLPVAERPPLCDVAEYGTPQWRAQHFVFELNAYYERSMAPIDEKRMEDVTLRVVKEDMAVVAGQQHQRIAGGRRHGDCPLSQMAAQMGCSGLEDRRESAELAPGCFRRGNSVSCAMYLG